MSCQILLIVHLKKKLKLNGCCTTVDVIHCILLRIARYSSVKPKYHEEWQIEISCPKNNKIILSKKIETGQPHSTFQWFLSLLKYNIRYRKKEIVTSTNICQQLLFLMALWMYSKRTHLQICMQITSTAAKWARVIPSCSFNL